jgi:hypothetical protein
MKVARNQTCPCGSGEKFKACCGKGEKTRTGVTGGRILAVIVGVAVIGGVAIAVNQLRTTDLSVQPYVYDAKNDQYFDPVHGHMHQGRPPQGAGQETQPASDPGATPEAWQYDAAKNQHYDPTHGHWHAGPAPNQAGGNPITAPVAGAFPGAQPAQPSAVVPEAPADGSPPAWDYDAENDRHWNPNTRTWDSGMPPLEAFTSGAE